MPAAVLHLGGVYCFLRYVVSRSIRRTGNVALIDLIVSRGGLIKNLHGQKNMYYQVNATYYSALGEDDRKMLLARALQLFMPGKPQIWYLDLFAGKNDIEAALRGGSAGHKEINRTNLSQPAIEEALKKDVVAKQLELLRVRNTCKAFAFDAKMQMNQPEAHLLEISWEKDGAKAALTADLKTYAFTVKADMPDGAYEFAQK